jgi:ATP-dependent Clp protease ATP-binding subunit ClpB
MNTINEAGAALPRWVRELKHMLPVRSQFVLSGNIRDNFLIPVDGQSTPAVISLVDSLWVTLSVLGYECLVVYDRVDGLRVVSNDTDLQKRRQSVGQLLKMESMLNPTAAYLSAYGW